MENHMEELLEVMKGNLYKETYFSVFDSICGVLQKDLAESLDHIKKNNLTVDTEISSDEYDCKAGRSTNTQETSPKIHSVFKRHKSNKASDSKNNQAGKIIREFTPQKYSNGSYGLNVIPKSYDFLNLNSPYTSKQKIIDRPLVNSNHTFKKKNGANNQNQSADINPLIPSTKVGCDNQIKSKPKQEQPSILNTMWQDHLNLKKQITKNSHQDHSIEISKKLNDSRQKSGSKDYSNENKSKDKEMEKHAVTPSYYLPRIGYKAANGKKVNLSMDHAAKKRNDIERPLDAHIRERSFDIAYQRNVDNWLKIHKLSHHREKSADISKNPFSKQLKLDLEAKKMNFPRIISEKKRTSPPSYSFLKH